MHNILLLNYTFLNVNVVKKFSIREVQVCFLQPTTETQGIHATKFKTETTSAVAPIKKNWTSKSLYDKRTRKVAVF